MSELKDQAVVFDPKAPAFRYKLWVRLKTPQGQRLHFLWSRIVKVGVLGVILLWLGFAGSLWAFVKYQRGIDAVRFVDVAFYPIRRAAYRTMLAQHHLTNAKHQIEQQAWTEALLSLRVALGSAPQNLEVRSLLAELYTLFKRPNLSQQVLEDGLPYAGDNIAYLNKTFNYLRAQQQFDRIISQGDQLLPKARDGQTAHRIIAWQVAQASFALKHYDEAEALLLQWQLEQTTEGQSMLANLAVARGQPELAIDRLKGQLERNPQNEALSIQLTRLYLKLGRTDEARRAALLRSFDHPDSPGAQIDLITIDWQSGNRGDYIQETNTYLERFSADARALVMLALFAANHAQPELAQQVLTTARTAGHPLTLFQFALMQAQCSAELYAAALETAQQLDTGATPFGRTGGALVSLKAWAYFGLHNQSEGDIWLQRYLTQPALHPPDALRLAAALEKMNEPKAQERVLLAAADQLPVNDAALIALLQYYARHNAWNEAGKRLSQLLALADPPAELVQNIQWHLSQGDNPLPALR
ncbi:MAG: tetratricopeptide repeat protein [Opitutaceae bacterium]|nr:tetratricopeptide repeat protein [Opitutaceae bacterium]MBP9913910.1 tetratricopeptide repeat protein [Opitutaceae bacterium]